MTDAIRIVHGDSRELIATLDDAAAHACISDPPYEIGFMARKWDSTGIAIDPAFWALLVPKLRPGAHLAAFGAARRQHRLACAIEDAGFEIRDALAWLYGQGMPHSLAIDKVLDKRAGAVREVVETRGQAGAKFKLAQETVDNGGFNDPERKTYQVTAPATSEAKEWCGHGTALKPAYEPIVLARAPFAGALADCVLANGTGALNIDEARSPLDDCNDAGRSFTQRAAPAIGMGGARPGDVLMSYNPRGRWPANVVCDVDTAAEIDAQSGFSRTPTSVTRGAGGQHGKFNPYSAQDNVPSYGDSGGASRFFYVAKPDVAERECGLDSLDPLSAGELTGGRKAGSAGLANPRAGAGRTAGNGRKNSHATVKPIDLMRWLVRLLTREGDLVVDPFTGSGTTAVACALEGRRFVGFELDERHVAIARLRVEAALRGDLYVGKDNKTQVRKTADNKQLSILDL